MTDFGNTTIAIGGCAELLIIMKAMVIVDLPGVSLMRRSRASKRQIVLASTIRVNGFGIDPKGPSILTALQEQLGLTLDLQYGRVEVLLVGRAEHPVED